MTGQAVNGRLPLVVTVHAEAHVEVDVALRHGLLADIAVARRALDRRTNVRGMIEADVRFLGSYPRADGRETAVRRGTSDVEFRDARAWLARIREG